jgi:hypothetical protein
LQNFSHTLEKQKDGNCEFLTSEKRCKLHQEFGAASKPSMCQLFPYSFTVTPDTVIASVSFASSAVLYNSGKLLSEQAETLSHQYELFASLFPTSSDLWLKLQIIDGQPLSWSEFSELDYTLSKNIEGDCTDSEKAPTGMGKKLQEASLAIIKELPDAKLAEREPRMESRPKIVDQILLKHLERLYFPDEVFTADRYDFDARELLTEMVAAPQTVSFGQPGKERKFADLIGIKLGKLPDDVDDLLNRFLYSRFFSKLFFGPGFHHLSLLAGIHHLRILHLLLRLKFKQTLCLDSKAEINFELACELVRTLERRLTQLDFSPQSQAMLEVLMASPQRQERLLFLAD